MTSRVDIYSDPNRYLEERNVGGWLVAIQSDKEGAARIGIKAGTGDGPFAISWGYKTITAALAAWYAWDVRRESEPQGWAWKAGNL